MKPEPLAPFPLDGPMTSLMDPGQKPRILCAPFTHRALVAGKGSDLFQEIRMEEAIKNHIPIYRRKGGGCSVLLDPGTIIAAIAFPVPGFGGIQTLFNTCTDWLIRGLNQTTGLNVYPDGISDLVVENRKIGGSCLYRSKGMAYYSASLLVCTDLEQMDRYLHLPPREPAYRRGRTHKNFLTTLSDHLGTITTRQISMSLEKNLNANWSFPGRQRSVRQSA